MFVLNNYHRGPLSCSMCCCFVIGCSFTLTCIQPVIIYQVHGWICTFCSPTLRSWQQVTGSLPDFHRQFAKRFGRYATVVAGKAGGVDATVDKSPETNMIGGKSGQNAIRGKEIRKKSLEIIVFTCFTMHISMNRPFDLLIFGLKNALILANDDYFSSTHLFWGVSLKKGSSSSKHFVECPGIAVTSWRLSAWKISRSYWQQRHRKGSESRQQIWFERWKRQSRKNQRPGGWLWIF